MTATALQASVRADSRRLGFDFCAFVPVGEASHADFFDVWIADGRAGEMAYLERNREKRRFPTLLAEPGAPPFQTMIVLGVDYHHFDLPAALRDDPSRGIVASYAWGDDYHEIIRPLLYELDAAIRRQSGRTTLGKCLVDTGPVLERDWAAAAGMGFTGKNCCTIRPGAGSWLLLAVILVPEVLAAEMGRQGEGETRRGGDKKPANLKSQISNLSIPQSPSPTCGRCTRCLAACPTDAFVGPYDLDPRRCISYWTIESRSIVPRALRPHFGNRIFGCDICQEVCPYNRRLPERTPLLAGLHARHDRIAAPLLDGFRPETPYWLDQTAFSEHFARSPIKRARRAGMLRNVCIALGNWASPRAIHALQHALADQDPPPRAHAAWALGRVQATARTEQIPAVLARALDVETDARVTDEIRSALRGDE